MTDQKPSRRSILTTGVAASASTAIVALPACGEITELQPKSEFVELCRECLFASEYVKQMYRRVAARYELAMTRLAAAHTENTGEPFVTMAELVESNPDREHSDAHSDLLRDMANRLEFGKIEEPHKTELKDAFGITTAEQAIDAAKQKRDLLFEQVMESPSSSLGDCVLKVAVADRTGQGGPVVDRLLSDLRAIGVVPNWQV